MLYDPKWDHQTKDDPFALGSLIAWLEKQPGDLLYDYGCNGACMLAQYFSAHGFDGVNMGAYDFSHAAGRAAGDRRILLPPRFNLIAFDGKRTFGAALNRARAAAR